MIAALASIVLQVAATTKPLPAKPVTPPPPPPAPVTAPTAAAVRAEDELRIASQRYAPVVRGCYEREGLRRDPALAANVDVTVTIEPQGTVREVKVDTLDVHGTGMSDVVMCVQTAAMQWHFSSGTYALELLTFSYKLLPPPPTQRDTSHS